MIPYTWGTPPQRYYYAREWKVLYDDLAEVLAAVQELTKPFERGDIALFNQRAADFFQREFLNVSALEKRHTCKCLATGYAREHIRNLIYGGCAEKTAQHLRAVTGQLVESHDLTVTNPLTTSVNEHIRMFRQRIDSLREAFNKAIIHRRCPAQYAQEHFGGFKNLQCDCVLV